MKLNDCSSYWGMAEYLPLDQVLQYWCQKSGFIDQNCLDAKAAAIVAACAKRLIQYERSDGKYFPEDSPIFLANRGLLLVHRESFDKWVTDNFEDQSPLPEKPLGTNERRTLLVIIAALCKDARLNWSKGGGAPANIVRMADELGVKISEDTVRTHLDKLDDAIEARQHDQPEQYGRRKLPWVK